MIFLRQALNGINFRRRLADPNVNRCLLGHFFTEHLTDPCLCDLDIGFKGSLRRSDEWAQQIRPEIRLELHVEDIIFVRIIFRIGAVVHRRHFDRTMPRHKCVFNNDVVAAGTPQTRRMPNVVVREIRLRQSKESEFMLLERAVGWFARRQWPIHFA